MYRYPANSNTCNNLKNKQCQQSFVVDAGILDKWYPQQQPA
jgi:hypothetical protein